MRHLAMFAVLAAACAPSGGSRSPQPASAVKDMGVQAQGLTGGTWEWIGTQTPVELIRPDDPAKYTLRLGADGKVTGKADCNSLNGSYTTSSERQLSFGPLATTRMLCPQPSRGEWYVKSLGYVRSYFFTGDTLRMDMMADGGTFAFRRAR
ncbi:MAG: META domain-containing protein [Gemmatimonadales bacterium]|jgi:para-nitrobenzyl esterase|nr:META domain-containing protein [Gemmatimonadales bacterium]